MTPAGTGRLNRRFLAAAAALPLLVLLVYAQTVEFEFLRFDDDDYVTGNVHVIGGLTWENARWAFGAFHSSNWHPVTWLSHQLDCSLFGLDAGGHHATSVLLHATSAVLLFAFLWGTTRRALPSWFVAAAFAIHPLRVQSVAWISERKDVLAGLFFFLTLLLWARYARAAPGARRGRYLFALCASLLGLASKPSVVTLPLVLLLIDRWPLERTDPWRKLVVEKLPFLGLALASALVTVLAQDTTGALGSLDELPLAARVSNAFEAYGTYLGKTVLPTSLAYFHPHPYLVDSAWTPWRPGVVAGALLVLGGTGFLVARRCEARLVTAWGWFAIVLLPMIGLVQVGEQAWAERYAYLALVGPTLGVAYLGLRGRAWPVAGGALLVGWLVLAGRAATQWRDSRALFTHALEVTERNYMAHTGLGNVLRDDGRVAEARGQYEAALAVRPDFPLALYGLGLVEQEAGDPQRAIELYGRAIEADPGLVEAHLNLGATLGGAGRLEEAIGSFAVVLELSPGHPAATGNLEAVRERLGPLARRPNPDPEVVRLLALVEGALAR